MTPSSVDLLPRSRGHRVHFQSITTAQDLISGNFRVSIKMRLMTAAWLCRTAVLYIYSYPLEDSTLTLYVGRIQMVTRDIGLPPMSWI